MSSDRPAPAHALLILPSHCGVCAKAIVSLSVEGTTQTPTLGDHVVSGVQAICAAGHLTTLNLAVRAPASQMDRFQIACDILAGRLR